jgi:hypothetical protein
MVIENALKQSDFEILAMKVYRPEIGASGTSDFKGFSAA